MSSLFSVKEKEIMDILHGIVEELEKFSIDLAEVEDRVSSMQKTLDEL